MDVIMDGLLIAGTLFAGAYCWVLSARVRALKSLDSGLGGSIVALTRQIELARGTLEDARTASQESREDLTQLVARADAAAAQLRLLIAAGKEPEAARAGARSSEPAPDRLAARRRDAAGPRLVPTLRAEDEAQSEAGAESIPKPRRPLSLEGLMRRAASPAPAAPQSEADLMAALTAIAAGAER